MKRPLLLIPALAALGGCAASYTEPSLPADHPANAAAEEAPLPTRWHTLDLAGAEPVTPAQAGPEVDHGGHNMGEMPKPAPTAPGVDSSAHKHDAPTPSASGAAAMYACPMHPEVTSDKPDQRCPKCGMKLKKQDGGKQP